LELIQCIGTAAASYSGGIRFEVLMKTELYQVFSASSSLLESHDRTFKTNKTMSSPARCYLILLLTNSCEKSRAYSETSPPPQCLKHRENFLGIEISCPISPTESVSYAETTEINYILLSLIRITPCRSVLKISDCERN
jgi:hypothetical protein